MAMRIGAEISKALVGLDRQVQIAKNDAGLAIYNDRKEKAVATDAADESEMAAGGGEAVGEPDSNLGNNLDVQA